MTMMILSFVHDLQLSFYDQKEILLNDDNKERFLQEHIKVWYEKNRRTFYRHVVLLYMQNDVTVRLETSTRLYCATRIEIFMWTSITTICIIYITIMV